jgi:hypothetical protein
MRKINARRGGRFDLTRKIMACGQIAPVVFASAISDTQAQPVVRVEDCGKTAVFECAASGQLIGGASRSYHYGYHRRPTHHIYVYPSYDQPTREREWLWNDP